MADKKISELPSGTTVYDADDFAIVQDGTTKQFNASAVKTYVKTGMVKADVGLGNVDNTSDANKPVSTATQTALNLKQDSASAATLTGTQTLTNKTLTSPTINGGTGAFTTLSSTGNTTLGDASTDTVTVNGTIGVGGAATANYALNIVSSSLTGSTQIGALIQPTATAGLSNGIFAISAGVKTVAGSYTTTYGVGINIADVVKGAGSGITNQHGIYVNDQTQGTNNYGITSVVSSGTNKWNIYASGTANNYFAGNVGIGTSSPSTLLDMKGGNFPFITITTGNGAVSCNYGANSVTNSAYLGTATSHPLILQTNSTERFRLDSSGSLLLRQSSNAANTSVSFNTTVQNALTLDSSGNLIHLAPATAPTLSTNGTMVFNLTSDTNLRVSVRGSDGVTRTANLTLA